MAKRFGVEVSASFYRIITPRYNIAPTQSVVVVNDDGQRRLVQMRWGLIPSRAKDPAVGNRMINARAETIAEKPAFRSALRKRRCLIPADGFYEWQKLGKVKQPVRIVLKNREPFGFAGIWERWMPPEGGRRYIVSTARSQLRAFEQELLSGSSITSDSFTSHSGAHS